MKEIEGVMNVVTIKKKQQKAEDFIGWKSKDNNLEVTGIVGRYDGGNATFKVICKICSQDPELFPLGYFISTRQALEDGGKPCGCSYSPRWEDWQVLLRVKRFVGTRFIINGFAEEFHGYHTKLDCECPIDGYKWTPTVGKARTGQGCPKCAGIVPPTEREAFDKCKIVCEEMGYKPLGFINGYRNNKSIFEYVCPVHGDQKVSYSKFTKQGTRCPKCWEERRKEISSGFYGWYPERAEEKDYLYVLNFNNDECIKVGRSFDVDERISDIKKPSRSGVKNIKILSVYTAKHGVIYPTEQEIHDELRERGFEFFYDHWNSNELFQAESMFILQKLLDMSGLERVQ